MPNRIFLHPFSNIIYLVGKLHFALKISGCNTLDSCFASSSVITVMAPLGNCQLLSIAEYSLDPTGNHLESSAIDKAGHKWSMSVAESLFGNISNIYLPFGRMGQFGTFNAFNRTLFPTLPFKI